MDPITLIIIVVVAGVLAIAALVGFYFYGKRRAPQPRKKGEKAPSREEEEGRRKGKSGEEQVESLLSRCRIRGDLLLNNVILSNPRSGSSTEIDHILFSTRGIFVVETKNRSGDIYGDDDREQWMQVLGKGDVRNAFYSPVKQNAGHVSFVRDVTGVDAVEGVVVFPEGNTQYITSKSVYAPEQLAAYLACRPNVLTEAQRDDAYRRLYSRMRENTVTAAEHEDYVRRKRNET